LAIQKVEMVEGGGGFGAQMRTFEMPTPDGKIAKLAAYDVQTMKEVWSYRQRPFFLTGVLTTAGGVAVVGGLDRYYRASDVKTANLLWKTRLGAAVQGFPVTYTAGGKKYVAAPSGLGVFRSITGTMFKDIPQPGGGSALYVFELPPRAR